MTERARDLGGLHAEFEQAKAEAAALVAGLSEAQFQWQPAPDRWSLAQILDHLVLVGSRYMRRIDRAIEDGHARGITGSGPFRYPWPQRFLLSHVEPPPRFRVPAPRIFHPATRPLDGALQDFVALQDRFQDALRRSEGLDLRRVRVPSPAFKYFKLGLGMAFAYMTAHQRRHFHQARGFRDQAAAFSPAGSGPTSGPAPAASG